VGIEFITNCDLCYYKRRSNCIKMVAFNDLKDRYMQSLMEKEQVNPTSVLGLGIILKCVDFLHYNYDNGYRGCNCNTQYNEDGQPTWSCRTHGGGKR